MVQAEPPAAFPLIGRGVVEVECQQEAEAAHLSASSGVVEVECQQEAEAAHLCASRMPHGNDESDASFGSLMPDHNK